MATKSETTNDIKVDPNALYLEEVFTDRRIGTIRRMTPVKKDGNRDTARPVLFAGETRYRVPWDFVIAICAAATVTRVLRRRELSPVPRDQDDGAGLDRRPARPPEPARR